MKFYTRKQLFLTVTVCFLTGMAVAGGVFFLLGSENNRRDESAVFAADSDEPDSSVFGWVETLPGQSEASAVEISALSQNAALEDERNSIAIYDRYNSAVVNISTEVIGYNWLFEPIPREGSSGSGAVISEDGYILTNTHVVAKAYKVYVTLSDGDSYEGTIVGRDPENDLAVLKIDAEGKKLTVIPFGSSAALEVGQKVLAIGNPFGYDRTLTQGIISGVSRPVRGGNNLIIKDMIQTDASINPGNSGGPLLNSAGELIGINTIIYSPSGGSVGIGFAVPVDTARRVMTDKFGVLAIGADILADPSDVQLYTNAASSMMLEEEVRGQIAGILEKEKLQSYRIENLDRILAEVKTDVHMQVIRNDGDLPSSGSSSIATVLGMALGLILYMFLMAYGAMVMQSVIEEKSSRVLEVIVSSVRPFDLMMGKILVTFGPG